MKKGQTYRAQIRDLERKAARLLAETRRSKAQKELERTKDEAKRLELMRQIAFADRDLAKIENDEKARFRAAKSRRAGKVTGVKVLDDFLRLF